MKISTKIIVSLVTLTLSAFAVAQAASVKLGVVSVNYNSPSIQIQTDAAIKAAKKRGWHVELFNGKGDQSATNNAAKNFIDRGFDAILNTASTNTEMSGVISYAKKHHVPYVSTFSGLAPGITANVSTNNTADGAKSALALVGRMGLHGHVVAMNWNVLPALHQRELGFEAVMKQYPHIKVTKVELKVPGQVQDAYNKTKDLLLAHPDISAFWTGWDEPATGVARAIKQAGKTNDVFVASLDGIPQVLSLIRSGKSPIKVTVAYNKRQIGVTAIDVIALVLSGKHIPTHEITLRSCLVTKNNAPPKGQPVDFTNCKPYAYSSD
jgi:ABC-type sugar transport system substrate-binding protein